MASETQIPLSTVVAFAALAYSILLTIIGFLAKTLYANDKKESQRQVDDVKNRLVAAEAETKAALADRNALRERLHDDEVATTKLEGKLNLVENDHKKLVDDVEEIKRTMVTRDLFDASVQNLRSLLNQIHQQVMRTPSTQMRAVVPPFPSDPPKRGV